MVNFWQFVNTCVYTDLIGQDASGGGIFEQKKQGVTLKMESVDSDPFSKGQRISHMDHGCQIDL